MAIVTLDEMQTLLERVIIASGGAREGAQSLARQTVACEASGQVNVGISHVFDYLNAMREGRIDGMAKPVITQAAPAIIHSDASGGLAQLGYDMAFDDLVAAAKTLGLAAFSQSNAYTCGALGTFVDRLAREGLLGFAATNGPPLLAGSGSKEPVYCTNPMAFAAPQAGGPPLVIDQSSSATAFISIRVAAEKGETIPDSWAIDKDGNPTTDPRAAMEGSLLAFGGARGANIALMVEVLAAGLSGANWSLDAPSFLEGPDCPGTGLFVLAISPDAVAPDFKARMAGQLDRLQNDYGVHVPGIAKGEIRAKSATDGLELDDALLARLEAMAVSAT